jgi:hypothetical protein
VEEDGQLDTSGVPSGGKAPNVIGYEAGLDGEEKRENLYVSCALKQSV